VSSYYYICVLILQVEAVRVTMEEGVTEQMALVV
jgi:hypothetical protein